MAALPGNGTPIPQAVCRTCDAPYDMASCVTQKATPRVGDIVVCSSCGEVSQFQADLTAAPVDIGTLRVSPDFKRLVAAAQYTVRVLRQERSS